MSWQRRGADIICGRDYVNPADPTEEHGLYRVEADGFTMRLGEPVFRWERYYELIIQSIRNDAWSKEASARPNRALNYWWGLPSNVLDVRLADVVPTRQRDLVEVLRRALLSGFLSPFAGELVSQEGVVQPRGASRPATDAIARMSWLNANVIGRLPLEHELSEGGLVETAVSGVIPVAPEVAARAEAKA